MPKQHRDSTTRPEPPRDERPELTPERNVEDGVRQTFPASDPVASTATQGARAASPAKMMRNAPAAAAPRGDTVTVSARFADREAAKLAVETVVRDAPLDRQRAEIRDGDDAVTVAVRAAPADAPRVRDMLHRCGGAALPER